MKIYYLEMLSPAGLNAKPGVPGLEVSECTDKDFQFNKRLYEMVGSEWAWDDKLVWSVERWKDYAEANNLHTWTARFEGTLAGYYELQKQTGGQVEVAYFGLLPEFIGRGLGGYLLTRAIQSAWSMDASRVWLHTCSLDHPSALGNYQARGMKIYKTETS